MTETPNPFTGKTDQEVLDLMDKATNQFYTMSQQIGFHPFIEFTGLMAEYVKMCQATHGEGRSFQEADVHSSGETLKAMPHHGHYLGEKMGCIFGRTFQENPEFTKEFLHVLMGYPKEQMDLVLENQKLKAELAQARQARTEYKEAVFQAAYSGGLLATLGE